MSSTTLRRWWPEIAWAWFVAANVAAMALLHAWETVPFHYIWVSLTVLYGFRVWSPKATGVVLVFICLLTGGALGKAVVGSTTGIDELTEVPLMASMFLAMVWHARRRQAALAEVERAHAREQAFLRDASHQIRTPITVARCHAELLHESTDPQTRDDAAVVLDELDRLQTMSAHLLTVAAAQDPGLLSRRESLDVGEHVREVVQRWSGFLPRTWRATVMAEGVVRADRERLLAALDALIENAVLATTDGDQITVAVSAEDGYAALRVIDNGVGVPAPILDRIFEPFETMRPPEHPGPRGTGLGLAIVKAVAEGHGGSVEIASTPGEGTEVVIRIPGFVPHTRAARSVRPARRSSAVA
jgi:two-component system OmpR family sensor kinase